MGKTLVSENRLDHFICPETNAIYMEGLLLTPGAKDALRNRGVEIVYGKKPESTAPLAGEAGSSGPDVEVTELVAVIVKLLKTDFGVEDPDALRKICEQVLAEIRK